MTYNEKKSLYESIMKEGSLLKREHWQIQYGTTNYDCEKVDVICNEEELPIICAALVRYDEKIRRENIACVAKRGGGVSFSFGGSDYQYCDCM